MSCVMHLVCVIHALCGIHVVCVIHVFLRHSSLLAPAAHCPARRPPDQKPSCACGTLGVTRPDPGASCRVMSSEYAPNQEPVVAPCRRNMPRPKKPLVTAFCRETPRTIEPVVTPSRRKTPRTKSLLSRHVVVRRPKAPVCRDVAPANARHEAFQARP